MGLLPPMKLSRNIAAVFFTIALLIGGACGQGYWTNTVLCASESGTVALEPGSNGTCAADLGKTQGISCLNGVSPGADCGSCQDVSISLNWAYRNFSSEDGSIHLLSNLLAEIPASFNHFKLSSNRNDFIVSTLPLLQTVRLLI